MAPYAYVPDPTKWVDPFGLSKGSGTLGDRMAQKETPLK